MTETAKELIENEIKSVEKRLHRGRNYGKTYNTGVKEGLMIARAHVIDSSTTDEKTVEKLQEQLNTAKKALTESEKMYQKLMDRFLNSEMNESARSHCESQLKLLFPAHKAFETLAANGGDDE